MSEKGKYVRLYEICERQCMKNFRLKILQLGLIVVCTWLVAVSTVMIEFPIPAAGGCFNMGDGAIFVVALLFGPVAGGLAGGVGSALADLIYNPFFAPYTLVIRGIEGWIVGKTTTRTARLDWIACALGGTEMVLGYFALEASLFDIGNALERLPFNAFQVVAGLAIGPLAALLLRRRLSSTPPQVQDLR